MAIPSQQKYHQKSLSYWRWHSKIYLHSFGLPQAKLFFPKIPLLNDRLLSCHPLQFGNNVVQQFFHTKRLVLMPIAYLLKWSALWHHLSLNRCSGDEATALLASAVWCLSWNINFCCSCTYCYFTAFLFFTLKTLGCMNISSKPSFNLSPCFLFDSFLNSFSFETCTFNGTLRPNYRSVFTFYLMLNWILDLYWLHVRKTALKTELSFRRPLVVYFLFEFRTSRYL